MGPLRKYFWKRKYKRMVRKSPLTAHLLLTMAKLELWKPSDEMAMEFHMRINLHRTLQMMAWDLNSPKL